MIISAFTGAPIQEEDAITSRILITADGQQVQKPRTPSVILFDFQPQTSTKINPPTHTHIKREDQSWHEGFTSIRKEAQMYRKVAEQWKESAHEKWNNIRNIEAAARAVNKNLRSHWK